MSDALKALEEALAEEIRLERQLVAVGAKKRDMLVSMDLAGVERATIQEQNLLLALGQAAEGRFRRTAEAAAGLGIPEAEMSVTRVAEKAGDPYRATLLAQAAELKKALREVARVNGSNKALTEQSLDHVRKFFEVLGGVNGEVTYTRRGLQTRPEIPKIMIDEVV